MRRRGERNRRHPSSLPGARSDLDQTSVLSATRKSHRLDAYQLGKRSPGLQPRRTIVIPSDDHALNSGPADPLEKTENQSLGGRMGRTAVEDVSGHQEKVDSLTLQKVSQMLQHVGEFGKPVDPLPHPPRMPVASVYDTHGFTLPNRTERGIIHRDQFHRLCAVSQSAGAPKWQMAPPPLGDGAQIAARK